MYKAALQTSSSVAGGSWSVAWDCSASPRNYNYKRYYQPGVGIFVSVDPVIGNLTYVYAENDPIRYVDPLGEDAEVLIGGPYDGHNYGHVALHVYGEGYDFVYDFGRYGDTWGIGGSEGEGMLRVWTESQAYIRGENALGRTTTGFIFGTDLATDKKIIKHFEKLIDGIDPNLIRGKFMRQYRLRSDYHALTNNCTTVSLSGLLAGLPDIDLDADKYNHGRGLSLAERLAAKASGWPDSIFLPLDLLENLKDVAKTRGLGTKTYRQQKRK